MTTKQNPLHALLSQLDEIADDRKAPKRDVAIATLHILKEYIQHVGQAGEQRTLLRVGLLDGIINGLVGLKHGKTVRWLKAEQYGNRPPDTLDEARFKRVAGTFALAVSVGFGMPRQEADRMIANRVARLTGWKCDVKALGSWRRLAQEQEPAEYIAKITEQAIAHRDGGREQFLATLDDIAHKFWLAR